MKHKLSFYLDQNGDTLHELSKQIGCIEEVEQVFNIEFAAAVENDVPLFTSDYLFTDKEDEFLEKYDGNVVPQYFRHKKSKIIYNLYQEECTLKLTYNDLHHQTGEDQFTQAKIISKKLPIVKNKMK